MEYLHYFVALFYDGLENFFKSFNIVSGRATLRVLYFSILYFFLAVVSKITNKFTFVDIWSSLLAVTILLIINCVSVIQRKDIDKFKKLLKGDIDDE